MRVLTGQPSGQLQKQQKYKEIIYNKREDKRKINLASSVKGHS
jgi:hypothetical protein